MTMVITLGIIIASGTIISIEMIQAFVLIAFSLAIVTAKRPSWKELEGYSFEQYVKDFRLPVQVNNMI